MNKPEIAKQIFNIIYSDSEVRELVDKMAANNISFKYQSPEIMKLVDFYDEVIRTAKTEVAGEILGALDFSCNTIKDDTTRKSTRDAIILALNKCHETINQNKKGDDVKMGEENTPETPATPEQPKAPEVETPSSAPEPETKPDSAAPAAS